MLRSRLNDALRSAMKAKDKRIVATVRLILAALKDRDIAARSKGNLSGLSEDELLSMLQSMIKQRRESIVMYEKGGRAELAKQELEEIAIIEKFLPVQLSNGEMEAAIKAAINDLQAAGLKDMGRVMAALKERHAGGMDFTKASIIVKKLLA